MKKVEMLYDLCIVGAGLFGSAAARHASVNPSLKVVLVGPDEPKNEEERRNRSIFGAHYDEGRITRYLDANIARQKLAEESIKRYKELEVFSGIKFYHPAGLLVLGEKKCVDVEAVNQGCALGNVPLLELDADLVRIRYPFLHLDENNIAYLDGNGAGHISPRKLAQAQQKTAMLQGCKILRRVVEEVTPLKEAGGSFFHEIITDNGQPIHAKRVILSPGAFVNFKKMIKHPDNMIPDLKLKPDTAVMLRIPKQQAMRLESMPSIILYGSKRGYALPPIKYPDGHYYLKIGYLGDGPDLKTLDDVRDWYLSKGNPKIIESHSKILRDLLPGLEVDEIRGMACVTDITPSNLPYIDRISPTVTVAIGGNGKGAKYSDEVGRLAAELSLYGTWNSDVPRSLLKVQWKET